jgi:D-beta-D-heptose 7-phosphate kinase/D-beta-D-heptose 1-phosphate adenosyltransferase
VTTENLATILSTPELASWSRQQRDAGRSIVFTNGCFDLLHRGHLDSLHEAGRLGDVLIVAINDDATVRALKGSGRPLLPATDRAVMLASLRVVTAVTIFAEPTPLATILQIRPDVLVKGSEYAETEIIGAPEVRSWGGRVARIPMRAGWSTSQLITTIKKLP